MPTLVDFSELLTTESHARPLQEVLGEPPTVLLGVSQQAADVLKTLEINTVFDLAMSAAFNAAVQLEDAADNTSNAMNRFGRPVSDLVRAEETAGVKLSDLRFEDVGILADIEDAAALKAVLGVSTVRDLAVWPPFVSARSILDKVFFPERLMGFDAESPSDLIPKSGEFPTERVQYTTLVLDQILRPDGAPALIDLQSAAFKPIDISPVTDPDFGFQTLGLGALLTLSQSWFMQGVTLGHLLHSMALAPGESTRIAVVDWSRKVSAGQTEQIGETEDLSQDTSRNRSISEVTEAVAREAQTGFSETQSESTTKQAGAAGGFVAGGFGFGASASIAKTKTSAESYSTSSGSREVGASMLQQASDRTHQHAHAARTRRASVVREVSQTEHENVSTRVVTNYNHMHAMTVQYYEVLQVYRTETALERVDRVVFVPFRLLDFSNESLLQRFRGVLIDAALALEIRDALINFETLEFVPERNVPFRDLRGTIAGTRLPVRRIAGASALRRRPTDDSGDTGEPPPTPEPPDDPVVDPRPTTEDVVSILWDARSLRIGSLLGASPFRRGSESLFVPADVRVVDAEAISVAGNKIALEIHLKDGTKTSQLQLSIALSEVDRFSLRGSGDTDVEVTVALTLSRNGVIFPLDLPTVTVKKGASETRLMTMRAASADVNLVQHLNDNKLHYSQAVFRNLDAAMIAGLLSPFSITLNGTSFPLLQVAEPTPLRIVGNALAFKINTDQRNDAEWQAFMASRGLVIGDTNVDLVPLSSGGIFAEAVLGRFNCAEKLDLTRFWNWQDSPIPIQPTEIAAVQTGSRAAAEDLRPGQLSAPIVSITPPAALPDPVTAAGVLAALNNGSLFRDMSGLADTIKLATETGKLSAAGATAAGNQAVEAMKAAIDLKKAKINASIANKNPSVQGATVNAEEQARLKHEAAHASDASAGKNGQAGGGSPNGSAAPKPGASSGTSGSSGAPGSTGSTSLDEIVGNDDSLRRTLGLAADSPVPTPAVTSEGVPLTNIDVFGKYTFQVKEGGATVVPTAAQLKKLIDDGNWRAASAEDFRSVSLADQRGIIPSFGVLLQSLSLMPSRSVKTLNVVAYGDGSGGLDFARDFTANLDDESFTERHGDESGLSLLPLEAVLELLTTTGPIGDDGRKVSVADVRSALAADGEVRLFSLESPVSSTFVQAVANLFQVRATGFVREAPTIDAEVIGETHDEFDPAGILDRSVVILQGGVTKTFESLENVLQEDRAVTGAFTAFPKRVN